MKKPAGKVFLSYAQADREVAREIAAQLSEAGLAVWDPEQELLPGAEWTSELGEALESASAFVVLISPEAMKSRSVSHEIEYALGARHLRGRLIPVIVRPAKDAPWILEKLSPLRYVSAGETGRQVVRLLSESTHASNAKSPA